MITIKTSEVPHDAIPRRRWPLRRAPDSAEFKRRANEAALAQAVGGTSAASHVRPLITQIDLPGGRLVTKSGAGRSQFFFVLGGRVVLSDAHGALAVLPPGSVFGDIARSGDADQRDAEVRAHTLGQATLGVATEQEFGHIVRLVPALASVRDELVSTDRPLAGRLLERPSIGASA